MRPIIIILMALAVTIAGATAMLVSRLVDRPAPVAVVQAPAAPPPEEVLVAAADIAPGSILKDSDLRFAPWPSEGLDERLVRKSASPDAMADFIGSVARRPILAGEPLRAQTVVKKGEGGVLAAILSPGMRAVSVPVTATSDVSGFVQPEDRVDVLLNEDMKAAENEGQPLRGDFQRQTTQVVLSDVRVLAVDDRLARTDSQSQSQQQQQQQAANSNGRTVTFELSPKDAEMLLTAQKMGEITLSLRSLARAGTDETPASVAGYTTDIEVSRSLQVAAGQSLRSGGAVAMVKINRAGATSIQSFAR